MVRDQDPDRRTRWATWVEVGIPLAVLAAGVLGDALLPPTIVITSAFAIAPFAASALTTPARTGGVAALSVVAVGFSATWDHDVATTQWWIRLVLMVVFGVIAVLLAQLRVRRERALQHMTLIAETAQGALLRILPGRIGDVGVAARYISATEAALVGGDLYEVADTPYGVRVLIGDVRGKGLDAVHLAAAVLATFRRSAFVDPALTDVAGHLDLTVRTIGGDEDFVTAQIAELRPNGTGAMVNCGHPSPLILGNGSPPRSIDDPDPALPLGLGSTPHEHSFDWPEGSRLLLFTDGLIEARDRQGGFFPLDAHAGDLNEGDLDEALDRLLDAHQEFSDRRHRDDLALVLTERRTDCPVPAGHVAGRARAG
jgi:serine phosphatase RsbU (regulator of sigma subunit)